MRLVTKTHSFTAEAGIDKLASRHQGLKQELARLRRRRSLTPAEQYRIRVIKKEKLRTKDLMQRAVV